MDGRLGTLSRDLVFEVDVRASEGGERVREVDCDLRGVGKAADDFVGDLGGDYAGQLH